MAKMTELFAGDVISAISILATFHDGGKLRAKDALQASKAFAPVQKVFNQKGESIFTFNNGAVFSDIHGMGEA